MVRATRKINGGEEITIKYGVAYWISLLSAKLNRAGFCQFANQLSVRVGYKALDRIAPSLDLALFVNGKVLGMDGSSIAGEEQIIDRVFSSLLALLGINGSMRKDLDKIVSHYRASTNDSEQALYKSEKLNALVFILRDGLLPEHMSEGNANAGILNMLERGWIRVYPEGDDSVSAMSVDDVKRFCSSPRKPRPHRTLTITPVAPQSVSEGVLIVKYLIRAVVIAYFLGC